jgi:hypothetical protein
MADAEDNGDDRLVDEVELSRITSLSVSKLRKFRLAGKGGPPYLKFGNHKRASVRYVLRDVRSWIAGLQRRG